MVLTNVVLNYILIFGKFGFPVLGIAGAAIASSISEAVSVMFFVIYTWKKVDYKKYGLFRFTRVDFRMLGQILSVSIWVMIQHGIAFGGWFFFFIAMEHLGEPVGHRGDCFCVLSAAYVNIASGAVIEYRNCRCRRHGGDRRVDCGKEGLENRCV